MEQPLAYRYTSSYGSGRFQRLLVCYLLLPSLLALLNAVRGTVYAPSLSIFDRLLLFYPPAIFAWVSAGIIIAFIIELTNARSWLKILMLNAIGAVISATLNYYVLSPYYYIMRGRWPWIDLFFKNEPLLKQSLFDFLISPSAIYVYITLVVANAGYRIIVPGARYLGGAGREGFFQSPTPPPSPYVTPISTTKTIEIISPKIPAFMRRIPPPLGDKLVLLSADEHYLRVVTQAGSKMILYRLSDAVTELAGYDGDKVHRSFWIAWPEVSAIEQNGQSYRLKMSSGDYVPVSRSHLGLVRRHLVRAL